MYSFWLLPCCCCCYRVVAVAVGCGVVVVGCGGVAVGTGDVVVNSGGSVGTITATDVVTVGVLVAVVDVTLPVALLLVS